MRIEVEYLTGTVYASDGLNQPEWPPHPARLFSAMVNAAKQAELGEAADDALRWLEEQKPPAIRAGESAETVVVTRFVPPNYPRFREPYQMLPWFRDSAKQQRMFPAQTPSDPVVSFEWPGIEKYPTVLPEIVKRIAHLGHSASFVRANLEDDGVEPTFVPDPQGTIALRVPAPGRLKELEECYQLGQWPRPAAMQRYRKAEPPLAVSGHGEMIVMRQAGGLPIPVEATLTFTEAFRRALIAVADQQGVMTPEIHGHENGPHCAYVPLPFAGWEHGNGRIIGAALVVPRGAGFGLRQRVYRACAALNHIEVPAFGRWQPGPVHLAAPMTLQPSTWTRPARIWATITPIVLKHRPSQKFERPLEEMIADYCVAAGLPRPVEVRAGRYPFLPSVPRAYDFRLRRKAAEPEERFAAHAWMRFDRLVEGPVLLGKLRHFGLGLLRPTVGSPMVIEDFPAFFKAANDGHAPFPWQERLVRKVAADRVWPRTIAIPTGCGKTSLIDIAVFLLACEAERADRIARLRTFFVVDRRLVVDQSEEHANRLATLLVNAEGGILAETANSLRRFGADPLRVAKLRGGMAYEGFWCEDPRQATVVTTTVDQLGSRLLFRGYGCSAGRRPIEAGLVGNDSLIVVDEAHLSGPFLDTLGAAQKLGAGIEWLQMSATARGSEAVFRMEANDFEDRVISQRVNAKKLARLRKCTDLTSAAVTAAVELSEKVHVVGVVVNTVDVARRVFERLATVQESSSALLIGRVRPLDRDRVLSEWLPRMASGRDRSRDRSRDQRLFVVPTQTIEVGADIDFDALVTEAAPLDVLRQRFGRLDRRGELGTTEALILRGAEDFRAYGDATAKTWAWLGKRARSSTGEKVVDFGISAIDKLLKEHAAPELFSPCAKAPLLLGPHLEAWCQTTAVPGVDPAVSPFLHGPEAFDADEVQLVWRADLEDDWLEAVMVAPPSIQEAMPVPVWAVRNWLESRDALIWRGADDARTSMAQARAIRPGDTVVVPSTYGGADLFGWNPESGRPVRDIGDEAGNWIRLHPAFFGPPASAQIARLIRAEELDIAAVSGLLDESGIKGINVAAARRYGSGIIIPRKSQLMDDGDTASMTTVPVLLEVHSKGVEKWAGQFASACGLASDEVKAVIQAAGFHDAGKADPRFQAILHGGDFLEAYRALGRGEVLAKSGASWTLADYRRMRAAVGYPPGARHEAGSVKVAESKNVSPLALHLIASHHGYARPVMPWWSEDPELRFQVQMNGSEVEFEPGSALGGVDSPVIDRFWSLCLALGYWRLALLEGILRLADHRQSKEEMSA